MKPPEEHEVFKRLQEAKPELEKAGWKHVHRWIFEHAGKRYDLSAADLTKLDLIVREGHFLVKEEEPPTPSSEIVKALLKVVRSIKGDTISLDHAEALELFCEHTLPGLMRQERQIGRQEALQMLLNSDAASFPDKYQVSSPLADTGDYFTSWNEAELRQLLETDPPGHPDKARSYVERLEDDVFTAQDLVRRYRYLLQELKLSDPYILLRTYATLGARIQLVGPDNELSEAGWRSGVVWAFSGPPERYRVHPDDLWMLDDPTPARHV